MPALLLCTYISIKLALGEDFIDKLALGAYNCRVNLELAPVGAKIAGGLKKAMVCPKSGM